LLVVLVVLIVSVVLVVLVVVVVVDHQVCGAWCMSGGWDGVPVIRGVSRGV
jgi:hypothetical protein